MIYGISWTRLLPLPVVVIDLLALLFSRRLWHDTVEMTSRTGQTSHVVAAHLLLWFVGGGTLFYWASYWLEEVLPIRPRWGMSDPSPEDKAVAWMFLRGLLLIALYAFTWSVLRNHAFRAAP